MFLYKSKRFNSNLVSITFQFFLYASKFKVTIIFTLNQKQNNFQRQRFYPHLDTLILKKKLSWQSSIF